MAASFMYWMASSWGMTLARAKKADWRMVLVRLPMPIFDGQVDGVDGVELDVVLGDIALGHRRAGGAPAPPESTGS